jgi:hypothetical protein
MFYFVMGKMAFREWIKTEISTPMTDGRRKTLEEVADAIILQTRDDIIRGGKWRFSPDVVAAEGRIQEIYQAVMAGIGSLKLFSEACAVWKRAGTRETAQIEGDKNGPP